MDKEPFEEVFQCKKCGKELNFDQCYYFGNYFEGKKIWCDKCFYELKEYLHKKYLEEKIPELKTEADKLLKELETKKQEFFNIVKQVKRYITNLNKENPTQIIQDFSQQYELNKFEVVNGDTNTTTK